MREKLGSVLFVWFLLYESCLGRYVVEKNSLKVISPDSLKNVYDSAIGYFGVLDQYGGTLTGAVIYPKANKKACKPFTDVDISIKPKAGDCPMIILADRGDCFLTLKAWNAQNAGAGAILIADDIVEPLIDMDTQVNPRPDYLQNLTIPSALVSKALGDSMKKTLAYNEAANVNLRLERS